MLKHFKPAVMLFLIFTVLTGVVYPAVVTGLAQLLFPNQANGSLMTAENGKNDRFPPNRTSVQQLRTFLGTAFRYWPVPL